jgi:anti-anti-sigma regulatory factor
MLTAKSGKKDRQLVVQLVGSVDDQANLEAAIGALPEPPYEMHVNCSQIDRINSVGVKGWIKYFQKIQEKRIPIFFYDCAPPIVQQMNLVFNFACGGKIVSLKLPFSCDNCEHNYVQSITVQALKQINYNIPNQKCPKCGEQEAAFDDIPKMYFKFLMSGH